MDKMRKTQGFPSSSAQGRVRTLNREHTTTGRRLQGAGAAFGGDTVSTYEITLKDHTIEIVEGADAYQQEGQMTTFFSTDAGRQVVDCWSTRLASFRTSEIVIIRRVERLLPPADVDRRGPIAVVDPADDLLHRRSA